MSALKDEIRDGDALKFKHAIAQAARDKRIKVLEDMVQEYQNTLHETKTTYSQELEEENAGLRDQLRDTEAQDDVVSLGVALCGRSNAKSPQPFPDGFERLWEIHEEGGRAPRGDDDQDRALAW